jgi:uncharacterized protein
MSRLVGEADLEDLARGAAILGTGGGGNPYVGMLLARGAIRTHGPVRLVDPDEVPDDALVVDVAGMGAPTVGVEKLNSGTEVITALKALQSFLGRQVTHVVCGEAGGSNSTVPFLVAATLGLPLVDADGIGRAFPELQMTIPALCGLPVAPLALADARGNTAILTTADNFWSERIARAITVQMGSTAAIASTAMSGRQVKTVMIRGTITLCQELGALVRQARAEHTDPVGAVARRLDGRLIFSGRVTDVERRTQAGFARGTATLTATDGGRASHLELQFQNEHLVARRNDCVLVTTPDLIMVLDQETAEPITTEELRYGLRAAVLAAPCDPRWRTPEGLALVGPRAFGYDFDYVAFNQRLSASPGQ